MEFRRRLGRDADRWNVKPQDHFILLREADNRPLSELTWAKSRCGQLCPGLRQRSPIVIGSLEGLMHRNGGFFKRPADFLRRRQLNFHRVCSCFSFECPFRRDWSTYALLCLFNPFSIAHYPYFMCTQGKFILR